MGPEKRDESFPCNDKYVPYIDMQPSKAKYWTKAMIS